MKKYLSIISIIAITLLSLVYSGCKKTSKDSTPPVVTVNGLATCYLQRGLPYYDADATAKDDVDGTLKVTATNNVNPNVIGTYNYTYSATDLSGNTGTATRTIYVVDVQGTYSLVPVLNISPYPAHASADSTYYSETLFLSVDMGGQLNFSGFGNHVGGAVASYLSSGSSFGVPSQTVTCGVPSIPRTFTGTGTISNPTAHTKLVITYTEVSDTIHHCLGVYTKD